MSYPKLDASTPEERFAFIQKTYHCIADCDMCGICAALKGLTPEVAFQDYIDGQADYPDVAARYR